MIARRDRVGVLEAARSLMHDTPLATEGAAPGELKPAAVPKTASPMREALAAQNALDRITKRETIALGNARARYDAERAEVMAAVSEPAKRILEAALSWDGDA